MEQKKAKKIFPEKEKRLIGIAGIGHSVGCTHFAIMMANYLSGYKRRATALLEWNRSGDFERLEKVCTGKSRGEHSFRVLDVDYYKETGPGELVGVLSSNYVDILIDFGVLGDAQFTDFLRCEKQFLVGSFSEWQETCFREFVRKNETGKKSWSYLAAFGSEETRKEFMRRPGIFIDRIPFSADAFSVTKECGQFFEKLI